MTKLSDTQLVLLTSASQRSDGHLFPLPEGTSPGGALTKSASGLIKRSFAAEMEVTSPEQTWREDGNLRLGLVITEAGRDAIKGKATPPPAPAAAVDQPDPAAARTTKSTQVIDLLKREQGATLQELVEATGWLPHTTRAALTGVRKKGHAVSKEKRGEATCYRIAEGS